MDLPKDHLIELIITVWIMITVTRYSSVYLSGNFINLAKRAFRL